MIQHILVPVDFSDCSINALHYAIQFSLNIPNQVELTILNTYNVPMDYSDINISFGPGANTIEVEERIGKEFKHLAHKFPLLKKLKYQTIIQQNNLCDAISEVLEKTPAELIILGSKGASGVDAVVLGSNAHRVIKGGFAPVLMIPANTSYTSIKNITLSSDYKGLIDDAIEPLKDISLLNNSKIHLLHISNNPLLDIKRSEAAKNLAVHLKALPHQFHFMLDERIEHSINAFIKKESIDLLVVVPRKKGLFERLFQKSESKSLIFHSKIPLLALVSA
jgi:nucleotide-binding universal stress UspA family protein